MTGLPTVPPPRPKPLPASRVLRETPAISLRIKFGTLLAWETDIGSWRVDFAAHDPRIGLRRLAETTSRQHAEAVLHREKEAIEERAERLSIATALAELQNEMPFEDPDDDDDGDTEVPLPGGWLAVRRGPDGIRVLRRHAVSRVTEVLSRHRTWPAAYDAFHAAWRQLTGGPR